MKMRRWMTRAVEYRYETVAVLNGAVIMVLELVGARIIAPHFGSSIYVWTAVIGVILGALSAGYWYGGKLADRVANDRVLAGLIVCAAGVLFVSLVTREATVEVAAKVGSDVRAQALVAALVLFAPVNFLMGMVSPYLAKLKITGLETAGQSVGALYAAGTAGSIAGTFLAGYWLIAVMGNGALGLSLVLVLILNSFVVMWRGLMWQRLALVVATVVALWLPGSATAMVGGGKVIYDTDSAYSRYQVYELKGEDQVMRFLLTDASAAQSGVYLNDLDRPAFAYISRFVEAAVAHGAPKRVLLVGGGAYTLPHLILARYPEAQIDVVEIDPKLDGIAEEYFGYKRDARVRVIHEDGRRFLNANRTKYDLVYMDAFSSLNPPFQLTTREAAVRLRESLQPGGLVVANVISAVEGSGTAFGRAEYSTYAAVLGGVGVTQAEREAVPTAQQNLIMVAGADAGRVDAVTKRLAGRVVMIGQGQMLTDDFAPVEQLTGEGR